MPVTGGVHLTASEPCKVLQLSDCHFLDRPGRTLLGVDTERSFQEVLRHLPHSSSWPPDLILLTGDLVQEPSQPPYLRLREYLQTLAIPWICLPGNHDDPERMVRILCRDAAVHCARRILTPRWQILCLNSHLPESHAGHLAARELDFLRRCLTEEPDRPTLVALHHPPLPVGSAWMDTMQLDNGKEFLDLLAAFPRQVRGVIFGHVHQVFCGCHCAFPLWSAPSTCFQFQPQSAEFALDDRPPGWRWLHLYGDGGIDTGVEWLAHISPGLEFGSSGY